MKKMLICFILGGIVFTLVGVVASTMISSQNVTYQNKTVNNALDELYNEATTGKELVAAAITNKGVSTTSTDTYETMATNISSIDTNHNEINQKINNLEGNLTSINNSIANLNTSLSSKEDKIQTDFKTFSVTSTGAEQTVLEYKIPSCKWYIVTVQALFVYSPVDYIKLVGSTGDLLSYSDQGMHPSITHMGPVYSSSDNIKVNVKWEYASTNQIYFKIVYAV